MQFSRVSIEFHVCPVNYKTRPDCSGPKELSQLDRAGDLYDSIAERLYDAMAGPVGMDLGQNHVRMLSQPMRSYEPIL